MLQGIFNLDYSKESIHKNKQRLLEILKKQSVFKGEFVLSSGQKSNYYLDTRLTTLSSEGISLISYLIWFMIQPILKDVKGVAGPSIGADPMICGVSQFSYFAGTPLKAGFIRKEAKIHGRGRQIEGPIEKGDRIIVLEDVITTGSSSLNAVNALKNHGCVVNHLICLVLREEIGKELLETQGNLKVHSLFTTADLLS